MPGIEGRSGEDGVVGESTLIDAGQRRRLRRSLPDGVGVAEVETSAAGIVLSGIREVQGLGQLKVKSFTGKLGGVEGQGTSCSRTANWLTDQT